MKKPGKLSINPEEVIKNDELVNLRGGGYGGENKCGWRSLYGDETGCYMSKEGAMSYQQQYGGYWCCDTPTFYGESCGT